MSRIKNMTSTMITTTAATKLSIPRIPLSLR